MKIKLFALIDCSAFYCSCERVFRPALKDVPVCVLSNNDGCVVSATAEVKALGIGVGTPLFKVRDILVKNKVAVFSSNYCLYSDMSRRVMQVIKRFSANVEQYSIDEAFIGLEAEEDDVENERMRLQKLGEEIHFAVLRGTGIPVRVSIAETKTLAKVGSDFTKKLLKEKKTPVACFWNHPEKELVMNMLSVTDVWGVGRGWAEKLKDMGIFNAHSLAKTDVREIGKKHGVILEKTALELRGVVCHDIDTDGQQRKSLIRSRSFGQRITDARYIQQAVATHVVRAAEKLRQENLVAGVISVGISTSRHADYKYYGRASIELAKSTNDSFELSKVAGDLFKQCYKSHTADGQPYQYSKAGVTLYDLKKEGGETSSFFDFINIEKSEVMMAMDAINRKFGGNAVVLASQGTPDKLRGIKAGKKKEASEWSMKRNHMSPRYTTVWDEVLKVKIG